VIADGQGAPADGVTVSAAGPTGSATAVSDATGLFVLTGLPSGTYTLTAAAAGFAFSPASQDVTVSGANLGKLAFTALPPIVPSGYTLSPLTLLGPGVVTTGTVTLNRPAPAGGAMVALSASDPKAAKVPATVTVPVGLSSVSFSVQGSGVSATTAVTLRATYNGGTAAVSLTVAPGDTLRVTSATYSQSTHVLTVTATGTGSAATITVQNGKTGAVLGTMTPVGGGSFSFQQAIAAGAPASVSLLSDLGGKTGQGVSLVP
jgi:hypothetical protein